MNFAYAAISIGIVSLISFAGVFTLAFGEIFLKRVIFVLVALAVGSLFGDALIHLIPEAFESGVPASVAGSWVMAGIILFFLLEKFLAWHHRHGECEESKETLELHEHSPKKIAPLILTADAVHNAIDGVIIGASFLISVPVGVATTLAVVLHEIPQEIADFGLLIHSGWSKQKALAWNFISALTAFLGLLIVIAVGSLAEKFVPIAAAFTAGSFIYIAGSDLVPELHKSHSLRQIFAEIISIFVGFSLMILLTLLE
jgi:zinc and cadmium transporter